MGEMRVPVQERFWHYVAERDPEKCWPWRGSVRTGGYGQISDRPRTRKAHQVSYEIHYGPVPAGLELDHLCRNPNCVNPAHLEAVTHAENMRRHFRLQTHCKYGHEYTSENTLSSHGRRRCRTCHCERERARRQSKKAGA